MMLLALLTLALSTAPEVKLPPKEDVVPALEGARPALARAIEAGINGARPRVARCEGEARCVCAVLQKVRFDVPRGDTVTVTFPLRANVGPSFTIEGSETHG